MFSFPFKLLSLFYCKNQHTESWKSEWLFSWSIDSPCSYSMNIKWRYIWAIIFFLLQFETPRHQLWPFCIYILVYESFTNPKIYIKKNHCIVFMVNVTVLKIYICWEWIFNMWKRFALQHTKCSIKSFLTLLIFECLKL